MLNHLPHASGVYQILCLSNGKIYIGSAIDLHSRCAHHRASLRKRKHQNKHLQAAWDKYGEVNFEFRTLELADPNELLELEQKWIDRTKCSTKEIGFNIYDIAGSPGDVNAQVWEGFIDPDGNDITIRNLFDFCRQKGLDFPSMHRLANGQSKLKSYKGWSHKNSVRKRDFIKVHEGFIDPDGNPVAPITNLAEYCRKNDLDDTHMIAVAHGRIVSHKGWTHVNGRKSLGIKTYQGFVTPSGKRVTITNLQAFCQDNRLDVVHMRELISGKRKSHKGWTWRLNDE